MKIKTCGIDLAKAVFQVHGVDQRGKVCLRKQIKRAQMLTFFVKLEPCLIGMEACGSAHYWGRKLSEMGHAVRLMAPQFVKPYVKTNKSDAADAEAICETVSRPSMRFVPIKNSEQQALIVLHRARQGFVKARTAQANQIRGLLSEFGIVMPKGISQVGRQLARIEEQTDPCGTTGHQIRRSDQESTSTFHQGQQAILRKQAGWMAAIYSESSM